MSSLNSVTLIGNVGKDPEIRTTQNGKEIANLTIATSETWKDKATGERKIKTEWHKVVIFSDGLVGVVKSYVQKGSKLMVQGALQTRSWEKDGTKHYSTEVVLQGFSCKLLMLNSKGVGEKKEEAVANVPVGNLDDEIPF